MSRTLRTREAMVAGIAVSLVLTVLNALEYPGNRVASVALTVGSCSVLLALVLFVLTTLSPGQRR